MSHPEAPTVSVVIPTFERPMTCERALESALAQSEPPLEVLVCDDCSRDDTEARMRDWERRDARVRYLRTPRNSGAPAATRNLGVRHARGDWVGFLDDDDEWLEGKLAAQLLVATAGDVDVIAANALRSDGTPYFTGAMPMSNPTLWDLLEENPIIMSSVLVRRRLLLSSSGFPTAPWTTGIDDYALWLELAAQGVHFAILGSPLVRYEDADTGRLSRKRARSQLGVARMVWSRALRRPVRATAVRSALWRSAGVVHVLAGEMLRGARRTQLRSRAPA